MTKQLAWVVVVLGMAGCECWHKHRSPCASGPLPPPPPPGPVAGNAYYYPAPRYPGAPPGMVMNPPNGLPPTSPPQRLPDDTGVRLAIPERSPAESAEGVDWLNANGYVAVLYLRAPGSDDSAERKRIENTRGLKYYTLELSPETLSKDVVEQFSKLVGDSANLPLFVYDKDGILAGGLWYLHFRLVDKLPDDKAIRDAGRLGLQEKGSDEIVAMWLAVQKYLKDQGN